MTMKPLSKNQIIGIASGIAVIAILIVLTAIIIAIIACRPYLNRKGSLKNVFRDASTEFPRIVMQGASAPDLTPEKAKAIVSKKFVKEFTDTFVNGQPALVAQANARVLISYLQSTVNLSTIDKNNALCITAVDAHGERITIKASKKLTDFCIEYASDKTSKPTIDSVSYAGILGDEFTKKIRAHAAHHPSTANQGTNSNRYFARKEGIIETIIAISMSYAANSNKSSSKERNRAALKPLMTAIQATDISFSDALFIMESAAHILDIPDLSNPKTILGLVQDMLPAIPDGMNVSPSGQLLGHIPSFAGSIETYNNEPNPDEKWNGRIIRFVALAYSNYKLHNSNDPSETSKDDASVYLIDYLEHLVKHGINSSTDLTDQDKNNNTTYFIRALSAMTESFHGSSLRQAYELRRATMEPAKLSQPIYVMSPAEKQAHAYLDCEENPCSTTYSTITMIRNNSTDKPAGPPYVVFNLLSQIFAPLFIPSIISKIKPTNPTTIEGLCKFPGAKAMKGLLTWIFENTTCATTKVGHNTPYTKVVGGALAFIDTEVILTIGQKIDESGQATAELLDLWLRNVITGALNYPNNNEYAVQDGYDIRFVSAALEGLKAHNILGNDAIKDKPIFGKEIYAALSGLLEKNASDLFTADNVDTLISILRMANKEAVQSDEYSKIYKFILQKCIDESKDSSGHSTQSTEASPYAKILSGLIIVPTLQGFDQTQSDSNLEKDLYPYQHIKFLRDSMSPPPESSPESAEPSSETENQESAAEVENKKEYYRGADLYQSFLKIALSSNTPTISQEPPESHSSSEASAPEDESEASAPEDESEELKMMHSLFENSLQRIIALHQDQHALSKTTTSDTKSNSTPGRDVDAKRNEPDNISASATIGRLCNVPDQPTTGKEGQFTDIQTMFESIFCNIKDENRLTCLLKFMTFAANNNTQVPDDAERSLVVSQIFSAYLSVSKKSETKPETREELNKQVTQQAIEYTVLFRVLVENDLPYYCYNELHPAIARLRDDPSTANVVDDLFFAVPEGAESEHSLVATLTRAWYMHKAKVTDDGSNKHIDDAHYTKIQYCLIDILENAAHNATIPMKTIDPNSLSSRIETNRANPNSFIRQLKNGALYGADVSISGIMFNPDPDVPHNEAYILEVIKLFASHKDNPTGKEPIPILNLSINDVIRCISQMPERISLFKEVLKRIVRVDEITENRTKYLFNILKCAKDGKERIKTKQLHAIWLILITELEFIPANSITKYITRISANSKICVEYCMDVLAGNDAGYTEVDKASIAQLLNDACKSLDQMIQQMTQQMSESLSSDESDVDKDNTEIESNIEKLKILKLNIIKGLLTYESQRSKEYLLLSHTNSMNYSIDPAICEMVSQNMELIFTAMSHEERKQCFISVTRAMLCSSTRMSSKAAIMLATFFEVDAKNANERISIDKEVLNNLSNPPNISDTIKSQHQSNIVDNITVLMDVMIKKVKGSRDAHNHLSQETSFHPFITPQYCIQQISSLLRYAAGKEELVDKAVALYSKMELYIFHSRKGDEEYITESKKIKSSLLVTIDNLHNEYGTGCYLEFLSKLCRQMEENKEEENAKGVERGAAETKEEESESRTLFTMYDHLAEVIIDPTQEKDYTTSHDYPVVCRLFTRQGTNLGAAQIKLNNELDKLKGTGVQSTPKTADHNNATNQDSPSATVSHEEQPESEGLVDTKQEQIVAKNKSDLMREQNTLRQERLATQESLHEILNGTMEHIPGESVTAANRVAYLALNFENDAFNLKDEFQRREKSVDEKNGSTTDSLSYSIHTCLVGLFKLLRDKHHWDISQFQTEELGGLRDGNNLYESVFNMMQISSISSNKTAQIHLYRLLSKIIPQGNITYTFWIKVLNNGQEVGKECNMHSLSSKTIALRHALKQMAAYIDIMLLIGNSIQEEIKELRRANVPNAEDKISTAVTAYGDDVIEGVAALIKSVPKPRSADNHTETKKKFERATALLILVRELQQSDTNLPHNKTITEMLIDELTSNNISLSEQDSIIYFNLVCMLQEIATKHIKLSNKPSTMSIVGWPSKDILEQLSLERNTELGFITHSIKLLDTYCKIIADNSTPAEGETSKPPYLIADLHKIKLQLLHNAIKFIQNSAKPNIHERVILYVIKNIQKCPELCKIDGFWDLLNDVQKCTKDTDSLQIMMDLWSPYMKAPVAPAVESGQSANIPEESKYVTAPPEEIKKALALMVENLHLKCNISSNALYTKFVPLLKVSQDSISIFEQKFSGCVTSSKQEGDEHLDKSLLKYLMLHKNYESLLQELATKENDKRRRKNEEERTKNQEEFQAKKIERKRKIEEEARDDDTTATAAVEDAIDVHTPTPATNTEAAENDDVTATAEEDAEIEETERNYEDNPAINDLPAPQLHWSVDKHLNNQRGTQYLSPLVASIKVYERMINDPGASANHQQSCKDCIIDLCQNTLSAVRDKESDALALEINQDKALLVLLEFILPGYMATTSLAENAAVIHSDYLKLIDNIIKNYFVHMYKINDGCTDQFEKAYCSHIGIKHENGSKDEAIFRMMFDSKVTLKPLYPLQTPFGAGDGIKTPLQLLIRQYTNGKAIFRMKDSDWGNQYVRNKKTGKMKDLIWGIAEQSIREHGLLLHSPDAGQFLSIAMERRADISGYIKKWIDEKHLLQQTIPGMITDHIAQVKEANNHIDSPQLIENTSTSTHEDYSSAPINIEHSRGSFDILALLVSNLTQELDKVGKLEEGTADSKKSALDNICNYYMPAILKVMEDVGPEGREKYENMDKILAILISCNRNYPHLIDKVNAKNITSRAQSEGFNIFKQYEITVRSNDDKDTTSTIRKRSLFDFEIVRKLVVGNQGIIPSHADGETESKLSPLETQQLVFANSEKCTTSVIHSWVTNNNNAELLLMLDSITKEESAELKPCLEREVLPHLLGCYMNALTLNTDAGRSMALSSRGRIHKLCQRNEIHNISMTVEQLQKIFHGTSITYVAPNDKQTLTCSFTEFMCNLALAMNISMGNNNGEPHDIGVGTIQYNENKEIGRKNLNSLLPTIGSDISLGNVSARIYAKTMHIIAKRKIQEHEAKYNKNPAPKETRKEIIIINPTIRDLAKKADQLSQNSLAQKRAPVEKPRKERPKLTSEEYITEYVRKLCELIEKTIPEGENINASIRTAFAETKVTTSTAGNDVNLLGFLLRSTIMEMQEQYSGLFYEDMLCLFAEFNKYKFFLDSMPAAMKTDVSFSVFIRRSLMSSKVSDLLSTISSIIEVLKLEGNINAPILLPEIPDGAPKETNIAALFFVAVLRSEKSAVEKNELLFGFLKKFASIEIGEEDEYKILHIFTKHYNIAETDIGSEGNEPKGILKAHQKSSQNSEGMQAVDLANTTTEESAMEVQNDTNVNIELDTSTVLTTKDQIEHAINRAFNGTGSAQAESARSLIANDRNTSLSSSVQKMMDKMLNTRDGRISLSEDALTHIIRNYASADVPPLADVKQLLSNFPDLSFDNKSGDNTNMLIRMKGEKETLGCSSQVKHAPPKLINDGTFSFIKSNKENILSMIKVIWPTDSDVFCEAIVPLLSHKSPSYIGSDISYSLLQSLLSIYTQSQSYIRRTKDEPTHRQLANKENHEEYLKTEFSRFRQVCQNLDTSINAKNGKLDGSIKKKNSALLHSRVFAARAEVDKCEKSAKEITTTQELMTLLDEFSQNTACMKYVLTMMNTRSILYVSQPALHSYSRLTINSMNQRAGRHSDENKKYHNIVHYMLTAEHPYALSLIATAHTKNVSKSDAVSTPFSFVSFLNFLYTRNDPAQRGRKERALTMEDIFKWLDVKERNGLLTDKSRGIIKEFFQHIRSFLDKMEETHGQTKKTTNTEANSSPSLLFFEHSCTSAHHTWEGVRKVTTDLSNPDEIKVVGNTELDISGNVPKEGYNGHTVVSFNDTTNKTFLAINFDNALAQEPAKKVDFRISKLTVRDVLALLHVKNESWSYDAPYAESIFPAKVLDMPASFCFSMLQQDYNPGSLVLNPVKSKDRANLARALECWFHGSYFHMRMVSELINMYVVKTLQDEFGTNADDVNSSAAAGLSGMIKKHLCIEIDAPLTVVINKDESAQVCQRLKEIQTELSNEQSRELLIRELMVAQIINMLNKSFSSTAESFSSTAESFSSTAKSCNTFETKYGNVGTEALMKMDNNKLLHIFGFIREAIKEHQELSREMTTTDQATKSASLSRLSFPHSQSGHIGSPYWDRHVENCRLKTHTSIFGVDHPPLTKGHSLFDVIQGVHAYIANIVDAHKKEQEQHKKILTKYTTPSTTTVEGPLKEEEHTKAKTTDIATTVSVQPLSIAETNDLYKELIDGELKSFKGALIQAVKQFPEEKRNHNTTIDNDEVLQAVETLYQTLHVMYTEQEECHRIFENTQKIIAFLVKSIPQMKAKSDVINFTRLIQNLSKHRGLLFNTLMNMYQSASPRDVSINYQYLKDDNFSIMFTNKMLHLNLDFMASERTLDIYREVWQSIFGHLYGKHGHVDISKALNSFCNFCASLNDGGFTEKDFESLHKLKELIMNNDISILDSLLNVLKVNVSVVNQLIIVNEMPIENRSLSTGSIHAVNEGILSVHKRMALLDADLKVDIMASYADKSVNAILGLDHNDTMINSSLLLNFEFDDLDNSICKNYTRALVALLSRSIGYKIPIHKCLSVFDYLYPSGSGSTTGNQVQRLQQSKLNNFVLFTPKHRFEILKLITLSIVNKHAQVEEYNSSALEQSNPDLKIEPFDQLCTMLAMNFAKLDNRMKDQFINNMLKKFNDTSIAEMPSVSDLLIQVNYLIAHNAVLVSPQNSLHTLAHEPGYAGIIRTYKDSKQKNREPHVMTDSEIESQCETEAKKNPSAPGHPSPTPITEHIQEYTDELIEAKKKSRNSTLVHNVAKAQTTLGKFGINDLTPERRNTLLKNIDTLLLHSNDATSERVVPLGSCVAYKLMHHDTDRALTMIKGDFTGYKDPEYKAKRLTEVTRSITERIKKIKKARTACDDALNELKKDFFTNLIDKIEGTIKDGSIRLTNESKKSALAALRKDKGIIVDLLCTYDISYYFDPIDLLTNISNLGHIEEAKDKMINHISIYAKDQGTKNKHEAAAKLLFDIIKILHSDAQKGEGISYKKFYLANYGDSAHQFFRGSDAQSSSIVMQNREYRKQINKQYMLGGKALPMSKNQEALLEHMEKWYVKSLEMRVNYETAIEKYYKSLYVDNLSSGKSRLQHTELVYLRLTKEESIPWGGNGYSHSPTGVLHSSCDRDWNVALRRDKSTELDYEYCIAAHFAHTSPLGNATVMSGLFGAEELKLLEAELKLLKNIEYNQDLHKLLCEVTVRPVYGMIAKLETLSSQLTEQFYNTLSNNDPRMQNNDSPLTILNIEEESLTLGIMDNDMKITHQFVLRAPFNDPLPKQESDLYLVRTNNPLAKHKDQKLAMQFIVMEFSLLINLLLENASPSTASATKRIWQQGDASQYQLPCDVVIGMMNTFTNKVNSFIKTLQEFCEENKDSNDIAIAQLRAIILDCQNCIYLKLAGEIMAVTNDCIKEKINLTEIALILQKRELNLNTLLQSMNDFFVNNIQKVKDLSEDINPACDATYCSRKLLEVRDLLASCAQATTEHQEQVSAETEEDSLEQELKAAANVLKKDTAATEVSARKRFILSDIEAFASKTDQLKIESAGVNLEEQHQKLKNDANELKKYTKDNDLTDLGIVHLTGKIKSLSMKIRALQRDPTDQNKDQMIKEKINLLACLAELHYKHTSKDGQEGEMLYEAQILELLHVIRHGNLNHGTISQVSTGEGKSLIIAMLAAINALSGEKVMCLTHSKALAKEAIDHYKPLFQDCDLQYGSVDDDTARNSADYDKDILYVEINKFIAEVARDAETEPNPEAQVLKKHLSDNEGKPPVTIIMDEFDHLVNKDANTVHRLASSSAEELNNVDKAIYRSILTFVTNDSYNKLIEKLQNEDENSKSEELCKAAYIWIRSSVGSDPEAQSRVEAMHSSEILELIKHALLAYALKENKHYRLAKVGIRSDENGRTTTVQKIVPMDLGNGRSEMYSTFDSHTHPMLSLIVDARLRAQNKDQEVLVHARSTLYNITNVITTFEEIVSAMPKKVRFHMYSGTAGRLEDKKPLMDGLNITDFHITPTQEKPSLELDHNTYGDTLELDNKDRYAAVTSSIRSKGSRNCLIIVESIKEAMALKEVLRLEFPQMGHQRELVTITDVENEANSSRSATEIRNIKLAGESGTICIATNAGGRGTDIKPSKKSLDNGGTHVIMLLSPNTSEDAMKQGIGRGARNGNKGSALVLVPCSIVGSAQQDITQIMQDNFRALESKKAANIHRSTVSCRASTILAEAFKREIYEMSEEEPKIVTNFLNMKHESKGAIIDSSSDQTTAFALKNIFANILSLSLAAREEEEDANLNIAENAEKVAACIMNETAYKDYLAEGKKLFQQWRSQDTEYEHKTEEEYYNAESDLEAATAGQEPAAVAVLGTTETDQEPAAETGHSAEDVVVDPATAATPRITLEPTQQLATIVEEEEKEEKDLMKAPKTSPEEEKEEKDTEEEQGETRALVPDAGTTSESVNTVLNAVAQSLIILLQTQEAEQEKGAEEQDTEEEGEEEDLIKVLSTSPEKEAEEKDTEREKEAQMKQMAQELTREVLQKAGSKLVETQHETDPKKTEAPSTPTILSSSSTDTSLTAQAPQVPGESPGKDSFS